MNFRSSNTLALAVLTAFAACSSSAATLEGSVWYRERMLTPPGTEVQVSLQDVSRADAAAEIIATTRFTPDAAPPWQFSLEYDPDRIDDRRRYALRARVEHQDRLLFINDTHTPAFPEDGDGKVDILVVRVPGPDRAGPGLEGVRWSPLWIDGIQATSGSNGRALDMVLESGSIGGFSGCNRFMGGYQLNGQRLELGPLASTMMACLDQGDQEQRFLGALQAASRWEIDNGVLILYDDGGSERIRFTVIE